MMSFILKTLARKARKSYELNWKSLHVAALNSLLNSCDMFNATRLFGYDIQQKKQI